VADAKDFDVYRGIGNLIKAVDPTRILIIKGIEQPSVDNAPDWLQFEMLSSAPQPTRRSNFYQQYMFQLICFSSKSNSRSDKSIDFHMQMAELYKPLLHLTTHQIKTSCISFHEAKISYLDLRTATFTAKSISTGGTPPLDTMCAVIISEACIDQPK